VADRADDGIDLDLGAFEALRQAAARLDAWHDGGRKDPGRPDSCAATTFPQLSPVTRAWAALPYRVIFDPDGRPLSWRRSGQF
jgi:hypothetical protein